MKAPALDLSRSEIRAAMLRTLRRESAGIDGRRPESYLAPGTIEAKVGQIRRHLKAGRWKFRIARRVEVDRGGKKRVRGLPGVEDATVLRAALDRVQGEVWSGISPSIVGGRPGTSLHASVKAVSAALKAKGGPWVLRLDVSRAYASTDAQTAFETLAPLVSPANVCSLDVLRAYQARQRDRFDGAVVEGFAYSPMLLGAVMNRALAPVLAAKTTWSLVYLDDAFGLCPSREAAMEAKEAAREALAPYGLSLNPSKSTVALARWGQEWTFLGFRYDEQDVPQPSHDSVMRLYDGIIGALWRDDIGLALAATEAWMKAMLPPVPHADLDINPFFEADTAIEENAPGMSFPSLAELAKSTTATGRFHAPGAFARILSAWKAAQRNPQREGKKSVFEGEGSR